MAKTIFVSLLVVLIVGAIAYGATVWKKGALDKESREIFFQAESLYREGEWAKAAPLFRRIVDMNPGYEEIDRVRFHLGECIRESDPNGARQQWTRVLEDTPNSPSAGNARVALAWMEIADNPQAASDLVQPLLELQSDLTDDALLIAATIAEKEGRSAAAREAYYRVIERFPHSNSAGQAYDRLSEINTQLLFSPQPSEFTERYAVQSGDTPIAIGSKFDSTGYLIEDMNSLEGRTLRVGRNIMVPQKGGVRIVVNLTDNHLYLYQGATGRFIKRYMVGTTKYRERTPLGEYRILDDGKLINPTWHPTQGGRIIRGGDPENPLGTRWMGFDKQYHLGIHGTNAPESIGLAESEGCIRMHNHDVEELFKLARIGTPVEIIE